MGDFHVAETELVRSWGLVLGGGKTSVSTKTSNGPVLYPRDDQRDEHGDDTHQTCWLLSQINPNHTSFGVNFWFEMLDHLTILIHIYLEDLGLR